MSRPRDHHFIPVFYLKMWANSDGKLIEYSRPYRNILVSKPVGPKATGFQKDLYAFDDGPIDLVQYIESVFLQRTDDLASRALAKLLSGGADRWTSELRSAWSRFTINFLIRHPHPFAEIRAITYDSWLQPDDVTQKEYERHRQQDDPLTFGEWILLQGDHLAEKIRIRFLQTALDNDIIGARFNGMYWNVVDLSSSEFPLLTSDWPLRRIINGDRMFFALPISPTFLFTAVTHVEIFENLRRMAVNDLVREINMFVVSSARLYVYGSDNSQERFIANRMSSAMVTPPFFPELTRAHANLHSSLNTKMRCGP